MKSIARCLNVFNKIFAIVVWSSLKLFSNFEFLLNRLKSNFCLWNLSFSLFVFKLQVVDWPLSDSEKQCSISDVLFSIFDFRLLNDCWCCFWEFLRRREFFRVKSIFTFYFDTSSEFQVQSLQQKAFFRDTSQRDSQSENINMSRLRFQCQQVECKFYDQHTNI